MPTIPQLSFVDSISSADLLPVYSSANGTARKMSIGYLLDFFQKTFASPTLATSVYVPTTGFNIAVQTTSDTQQWIVLQPVSTLASGTVTLPLSTSVADGTEVLVTTTQQITAFSVSLNGAASAYGVPAVLAADDNFRLRFIQALNSWYRIA